MKGKGPAAATMTLPSVETAHNWSGLITVDGDDQPLGRITDIYLDHDTGQPEWALVATRSGVEVGSPGCGRRPSCLFAQGLDELVFAHRGVGLPGPLA